MPSVLWVLLVLGVILAALITVIAGFCVYCWATSGVQRERLARADIIIKVLCFVIAAMAIAMNLNLGACGHG